MTTAITLVAFQVALILIALYRDAWPWWTWVPAIAVIVCMAIGAVALAIRRALNSMPADEPEWRD